MRINVLHIHGYGVYIGINSQTGIIVTVFGEYLNLTEHTALVTGRVKDYGDFTLFSAMYGLGGILYCGAAAAGGHVVNLNWIV
jgi:hypothetical protein